MLDVTSAVHPPRRIVRDGFLVGITNPKGIIFFTAILPQFVDPDGGPAGLQMLVLGTISVLVALVSDSVWGLVAGSARSWLAGSPRRLELLGGTGGLVMIGLGVAAGVHRQTRLTPAVPLRVTPVIRQAYSSGPSRCRAQNRRHYDERHRNRAKSHHPPLHGTPAPPGFGSATPHVTWNRTARRRRRAAKAAAPGPRLPLPVGVTARHS